MVAKYHINPTFTKIYYYSIGTLSLVTVCLRHIVLYAGFYDHMMIIGMLEECNKMCNLNHPNVLSLTGVCIDGGSTPFIVMPFMDNGSLLHYLKEHQHELIVLLGQGKCVSCS